MPNVIELNSTQHWQPIAVSGEVASQNEIFGLSRVRIVFRVLQRDYRWAVVRRSRRGAGAADTASQRVDMVCNTDPHRRSPQPADVFLQPS